MKTYEITYGSGLAWPHKEIVEIDDFETEQDALNKMIDDLEQRGYYGCFATQDEIDSGVYNEDEYIVGGNHGRYLLHFGNLRIEELIRVEEAE